MALTADPSRLNTEFFKALAHPLRIRVLELLRDDDRSVTELLDHVDAQQPYLSQQLSILRRGGIVMARRQGAHVMYALADDRITELLALSRQIQLDMISAIHDGLREA